MRWLKTVLVLAIAWASVAYLPSLVSAAGTSLADVGTSSLATLPTPPAAVGAPAR